MNIKKVTSKDLKKIRDIESMVFGKDAFSENLIKKLIKENLFFLKLEKSNIKKQLIGFVIVISDQKDSANIINFLINPKYQNKGYGSFLLNHTILKIKEFDKVKKIILNVNTNNPSAIKLYEKIGFQIIQKINNYYQLKDSAYLMELKFDTRIT